MIVFRVDANEQVATGHLMRTLSIASACRKCGLTCEFWLAEEKETERIAKAGFPYRILETRWDALEDELPVMKQRLQAQQVDWLVVDSYCATVRYLAELNRIVPVFYVDDFRKEHYEVSALLQYIPCRERQKTPEGLHESTLPDFYMRRSGRSFHIFPLISRGRRVFCSRPAGQILTIWRAEFLRTAHRCRNCRSICGM
mgnify:CR=1 FL=1